jgi:predicted dinucleotide-binding enzyme
MTPSEQRRALLVAAPKTTDPDIVAARADIEAGMLACNEAREALRLALAAGDHEAAAKARRDLVEQGDKVDAAIADFRRATR